MYSKSLVRQNGFDAVYLYIYMYDFAAIYLHVVIKHRYGKEGKNDYTARPISIISQLYTYKYYINDQPLQVCRLE